jgi:hypothetical protein
MIDVERMMKQLMTLTRWKKNWSVTFDESRISNAMGDPFCQKILAVVPDNAAE